MPRLSAALPPTTEPVLAGRTPLLLCALNRPRPAPDLLAKACGMAGTVSSVAASVILTRNTLLQRLPFPPERRRLLASSLALGGSPTMASIGVIFFF